MPHDAQLAPLRTDVDLDDLRLEYTGARGHDYHRRRAQTTLVIAYLETIRSPLPATIWPAPLAVPDDHTGAAATLVALKASHRAFLGDKRHGTISDEIHVRLTDLGYTPNSGAIRNIDALRTFAELSAIWSTDTAAELLGLQTDVARAVRDLDLVRAAELSTASDLLDVMRDGHPDRKDAAVCIHGDHPDINGAPYGLLHLRSQGPHAPPSYHLTVAFDDARSENIYELDEYQATTLLCGVTADYSARTFDA